MKSAKLNLIALALIISAPALSFAVNEDTHNVAPNSPKTKVNTNKPGTLNENGNYHHTGSAKNTRAYRDSDAVTRDADMNSDAIEKNSADVHTNSANRVINDDRYSYQEQQAENRTSPFWWVIAAIALVTGLYFAMRNRRQAPTDPRV